MNTVYISILLPFLLLFLILFSTFIYIFRFLFQMISHYSIIQYFSFVIVFRLMEYNAFCFEFVFRMSLFFMMVLNMFLETVEVDLFWNRRLIFLKFILIDLLVCSRQALVLTNNLISYDIFILLINFFQLCYQSRLAFSNFYKILKY